MFSGGDQMQLQVIVCIVESQTSHWQACLLSELKKIIKTSFKAHIRFIDLPYEGPF